MNIPNVKSNSVRAIGATPEISICAGWMSPPPDDIDETTCVANHCTTSAKSDITTTVGTAKFSQVPRSHLVRVMPWVQCTRDDHDRGSDAPGCRALLSCQRRSKNEVARLHLAPPSEVLTKLVDASP